MKNNNFLLSLVGLVILTSWAQMVFSDEAQTVPIHPKILKTDQLGSFIRLEPPLVVMADHPMIHPQINNAKKNIDLQKRRKLNARGRPIKTHASFAYDYPKIEKIKLDVPSSTHQVVNHGPTFIFQDMTDRSNKSAISLLTQLSLEERYLQVDALRRSASEKKQR